MAELVDEFIAVQKLEQEQPKDSHLAVPAKQDDELSVISSSDESFLSEELSYDSQSASEDQAEQQAVEAEIERRVAEQLEEELARLNNF